MLKNRFQSLKELRFQISSQKMHHFVILWITCCLILHNLIIRIEEEAGMFDMNEWYTPEEGDGGVDGDNEDNAEALPPDGQQLRERVMADLFSNF
jgi:hypothetical protein